MSDSEELNIGDFDPSTYQHVLPEGAHDYDDYDSEYEEGHPELGFTDEQVEEGGSRSWIPRARNSMKSIATSLMPIIANMAGS